MQVSRMDENSEDYIVKRVSVPVSLEELMNGLTKEILKKQPKDIVVFASEYFTKLLKLRDEGYTGLAPARTRSSAMKLTSRNGKQTAKNVTRSQSTTSETIVTKPLSRQVTLHAKHPLATSDASRKINHKAIVQNHIQRKHEVDPKGQKKSPSRIETNSVENKFGKESVQAVKKQIGSKPSSRNKVTGKENIPKSVKDDELKTDSARNKSSHENKHSLSKQTSVKSESGVDEKVRLKNKNNEKAGETPKQAFVPKNSSIEEEGGFVKDGLLAVVAPKVRKKTDNIEEDIPISLAVPAIISTVSNKKNKEKEKQIENEKSVEIQKTTSGETENTVSQNEKSIKIQNATNMEQGQITPLNHDESGKRDVEEQVTGREADDKELVKDKTHDIDILQQEIESKDSRKETDKKDIGQNQNGNELIEFKEDKEKQTNLGTGNKELMTENESGSRDNEIQKKKEVQEKDNNLAVIDDDQLAKEVEEKKSQKEDEEKKLEAKGDSLFGENNKQDMQDEKEEENSNRAIEDQQNEEVTSDRKKEDEIQKSVDLETVVSAKKEGFYSNKSILQGMDTSVGNETESTDKRILQGMDTSVGNEVESLRSNMYEKDDNVEILEKRESHKNKIDLQTNLVKDSDNISEEKVEESMRTKTKEIEENITEKNSEMKRTQDNNELFLQEKIEVLEEKSDQNVSFEEQKAQEKVSKVLESVKEFDNDPEKKVKDDENHENGKLKETDQYEISVVDTVDKKDDKEVMKDKKNDDINEAKSDLLVETKEEEFNNKNNIEKASNIEDNKSNNITGGNDENVLQVAEATAQDNKIADEKLIPAVTEDPLHSEIKTNFVMEAKGNVIETEKGKEDENKTDEKVLQRGNNLQGNKEDVEFHVVNGENRVDTNISKEKQEQEIEELSNERKNEREGEISDETKKLESIQQKENEEELTVSGKQEDNVATREDLKEIAKGHDENNAKEEVLGQKENNLQDNKGKQEEGNEVLSKEYNQRKEEISTDEIKKNEFIPLKDVSVSETQIKKEEIVSPDKQEDNTVLKDDLKKIIKDEFKAEEIPVEQKLPNKEQSDDIEDKTSTKDDKVQTISGESKVIDIQNEYEYEGDTNKGIRHKRSIGEGKESFDHDASKKSTEEINRREQFGKDKIGNEVNLEDTDMSKVNVNHVQSPPSRVTNDEVIDKNTDEKWIVGEAESDASKSISSSLVIDPVNINSAILLGSSFKNKDDSLKIGISEETGNTSEIKEKILERTKTVEELPCQKVVVQPLIDHKDKQSEEALHIHVDDSKVLTNKNANEEHKNENDANLKFEIETTEKYSKDELGDKKLDELKHNIQDSEIPSAIASTNHLNIELETQQILKTNETSTAKDENEKDPKMLHIGEGEEEINSSSSTFMAHVPHSQAACISTDDALNVSSKNTTVYNIPTRPATSDIATNLVPNENKLDGSGSKHSELTTNNQVHLGGISSTFFDSRVEDSVPQELNDTEVTPAESRAQAENRNSKQEVENRKTSGSIENGNSDAAFENVAKRQTYEEARKTTLDFLNVEQRAAFDKGDILFTKAGGKEEKERNDDGELNVQDNVIMANEEEEMITKRENINKENIGQMTSPETERELIKNEKNELEMNLAKDKLSTNDTLINSELHSRKVNEGTLFQEKEVENTYTKKAETQAASDNCSENLVDTPDKEHKKYDDKEETVSKEQCTENKTEQISAKTEIEGETMIVNETKDNEGYSKTNDEYKNITEKEGEEKVEVNDSINEKKLAIPETKPPLKETDNSKQNQQEHEKDGIISDNFVESRLLVKRDTDQNINKDEIVQLPPSLNLKDSIDNQKEFLKVDSQIEADKEDDKKLEDIVKDDTQEEVHLESIQLPLLGDSKNEQVNEQNQDKPKESDDRNLDQYALVEATKEKTELDEELEKNDRVRSEVEDSCKSELLHTSEFHDKITQPEKVILKKELEDSVSKELLRNEELSTQKNVTPVDQFVTKTASELMAEDFPETPKEIILTKKLEKSTSKELHQNEEPLIQTTTADQATIETVFEPKDENSSKSELIHTSEFHDKITQPEKIILGKELEDFVTTKSPQNEEFLPSAANQSSIKDNSILKDDDSSKSELIHTSEFHDKVSDPEKIILEKELKDSITELPVKEQSLIQMHAIAVDPTTKDLSNSKDEDSFKSELIHTSELHDKSTNPENFILEKELENFNSKKLTENNPAIQMPVVSVDQSTSDQVSSKLFSEQSEGNELDKVKGKIIEIKPLNGSNLNIVSHDKQSQSVAFDGTNGEIKSRTSPHPEDANENKKDRELKLSQGRGTSKDVGEEDGETENPTDVKDEEKEIREKIEKNGDTGIESKDEVNANMEMKKEQNDEKLLTSEMGDVKGEIKKMIEKEVEGQKESYKGNLEQAKEDVKQNNLPKGKIKEVEMNEGELLISIDNKIGGKEENYKDQTACEAHIHAIDTDSVLKEDNIDNFGSLAGKEADISENQRLVQDDKGIQKEAVIEKPSSEENVDVDQQLMAMEGCPKNGIKPNLTLSKDKGKETTTDLQQKELIEESKSIIATALQNDKLKTAKNVNSENASDTSNLMNKKQIDSNASGKENKGIRNGILEKKPLRKSSSAFSVLEKKTTKQDNNRVKSHSGRTMSFQNDSNKGKAKKGNGTLNNSNNQNGNAFTKHVEETHKVSKRSVESNSKQLINYGDESKDFIDPQAGKKSNINASLELEIVKELPKQSQSAPLLENKVSDEYARDVILSEVDEEEASSHIKEDTGNKVNELEAKYERKVESVTESKDYDTIVSADEREETEPGAIDFTVPESVQEVPHRPLNVDLLENVNPDESYNNIPLDKVENKQGTFKENINEDIVSKVDKRDYFAVSKEKDEIKPVKEKFEEKIIPVLELQDFLQKERDYAAKREMFRVSKKNISEIKSFGESEDNKLLHTSELHDSITAPEKIIIEKELEESFPKEEKQNVTDDNEKTTATALLHTSEFHDKVTMPEKTILDKELKASISKEDTEDDFDNGKSTRASSSNQSTSDQVSSNLFSNQTSEIPPLKIEKDKALEVEKGCKEIEATNVTSQTNFPNEDLKTDRSTSSASSGGTSIYIQTEQLNGASFPLSVQLTQDPGASPVTSTAPVRGPSAEASVLDDDGRGGGKGVDDDVDAVAATQTQPSRAVEGRAAGSAKAPVAQPDEMDASSKTKRNNASIVRNKENKNMEEVAATKIQASFRGYQVRKQLKTKNGGSEAINQGRVSRRKNSGKFRPNEVSTGKNMSQQKNLDIEERSATKIQAGVRGFLARRRFKKEKMNVTPESP